MAVERVHHTTEKGIAVVGLERPPVNALTLPYLQELSRIFRQVLDAKSTAMILTGAGTTFSAGLDLRVVPNYDRSEQTQLVDCMNEIFYQLYSFPIPTVAALNGNAIAGGLLLALCCDYRIAPEGTFRFGLAEVRVGIPYPLNAMAVVKAELSHLMSRELALLGRNLTPRQALARGVVDELWEAKEIQGRGRELAAELARYPSDTYARVKRQLRGDIFERMERVIAEKSDPARERWIEVGV